MGGYGAFNIARLDPGRFCGVGGHSPALWETFADTADGAFDNSTDFDTNDVIAIAGDEPNPYAEARLWIDAGESDPFLDADDALEAALRANGTAPIVKRSAGGHDSAYWNGNWDEYLGFYAHALRKCVPDFGSFADDDGTKGDLSDSSGPSTSEAQPDDR